MFVMQFVECRPDRRFDAVEALQASSSLAQTKRNTVSFPVIGSFKLSTRLTTA